MAKKKKGKGKKKDKAADDFVDLADEADGKTKEGEGGGDDV